MSLRRLFLLLWVRRWQVIALVAATLATIVFVGRQMPPRYEGEARVIVEAMRPDPVTGQAIDAKAFGGYMNSQLLMIQSYAVTGRVVDMAGMTNSAVLAELFQASGAAGRMDFRRWIADQISIRVGARMSPDSNIMEIVFVSGDPAEAATFADMFRTAFIEESQQQKADPAARNARATREAIERVQSQVAIAEKKLLDFERANGIVAAAFREGIERERLSALARQTPGRATGPTGRRGPVAGAEFSRVAARVVELDAAIASARGTLGPNHPQVQAMVAERNAMASRSMSGGSSGAGGYGPSPAMTQAALASAYSDAQRRTLAARGNIDEAGRLASDVMMLRDQIEGLSEQAIAYDMIAGSTASDMVKLGDVEPPEEASFPNWPVLTAWGLIIGFGYAIPLVLIAEFRRLRVRDADDIGIATGVPVVGQVRSVVNRGRIRQWWHRFKQRRAAARAQVQATAA